MKLLLASAGFYTEDIAEAAAQLANKRREDLNVAIINEASAVETDDKRWLIEELDRIKRYIGGEIDFINLLALEPDVVQRRLERFDVIYVLGGHADYLMSVFEKTGFADLLPLLLKTKVYVGSSAGAMVAGRRINTAVYEDLWGERNDFDVEEYLQLVDFAIKPHMESPFFPENTADNLQKAGSNTGFTVYGLKDTQAIVYDNGELSFVGEPFEIKRYTC